MKKPQPRAPIAFHPAPANGPQRRQWAKDSMALAHSTLQPAPADKVSWHEVMALRPAHFEFALVHTQEPTLANPTPLGDYVRRWQDYEPEESEL